MSETKQKILHVALDLFSRNGFAAVSIRDICKRVGIKESSVYYHFQNKRSILDELLHQFEMTADDLMSRLEQAVHPSPGFLQDNFFDKTCDCFFEQYLMDEFCNKVMRLLLMEQFHDQEMQKLYDFWMFEKPLKFQSEIFAGLAGALGVEHMNSDYLAVKFYAPILLFSQRWLFCGQLSAENKQSFREAAYQHVQSFFQELMQSRSMTLTNNTKQEERE